MVTYYSVSLHEGFLGLELVLLWVVFGLSSFDSSCDQAELLSLLLNERTIHESWLIHTKENCSLL